MLDMRRVYWCCMLETFVSLSLVIISLLTLSITARLQWGQMRIWKQHDLSSIFASICLLLICDSHFLRTVYITQASPSHRFAWLKTTHSCRAEIRMCSAKNCTRTPQWSADVSNLFHSGLTPLCRVCRGRQCWQMIIPHILCCQRFLIVLPISGATGMSVSVPTVWSCIGSCCFFSTKKLFLELPNR